MELEIAVKCVDQAFRICQSLKGHRSDELRRVLCHYDMHLTALFYEHTGNIGHFVCGDTAGHSKYNGFSF